jgi:hypothetical protein
MSYQPSITFHVFVLYLHCYFYWPSLCELDWVLNQASYYSHVPRLVNYNLLVFERFLYRLNKFQLWYFTV